MGGAGLPDVGLDEKTVLGHIVLAGLEALKHLDVAAAAPTELERTGLVNFTVLGKHDGEGEERLER